MRPTQNFGDFVRLAVRLMGEIPAARHEIARVRRVSFSARGKARWLDARARVDSRRPGPRTRALAGLLRTLPERQRCQALHAFCRDGIRYVRDPSGREELADCETILGRLIDDCDGKATVFCTVAPLVGIEARMRAVFPRPGDFRHVQAEARWLGSHRRPDASTDGWVLCEFICEGVELGEGSERARRDEAGKIITTDPR